MKTQIWRIMPTFLKRALVPLRLRYDMNELQRIRSIPCNVECLLPVNGVINDLSIEEIFTCPEIETEWQKNKTEIDMFGIPDGTGEVNSGDRRAIYYLISRFNPSSVLEIGTHIGASTIHIAAAFNKGKDLENKNQSSLVSVDIADVNNPIAKPWLKHGLEHSPIEMITRMGYKHFVDFVTDTSLDYFAKCE